MAQIQTPVRLVTEAGIDKLKDFVSETHRQWIAEVEGGLRSAGGGGSNPAPPHHIPEPAFPSPSFQDSYSAVGLDPGLIWLMAVFALLILIFIIILMNLYKLCRRRK